VIDLLTAILAGGRASRLYRAVRDRRLASSILASNYALTELGVFLMHATARPERSASALRTSWDQVRRVREGDVTAAEVERARQFVAAQWVRRLGAGQRLSGHAADRRSGTGGRGRRSLAWREPGGGSGVPSRQRAAVRRRRRNRVRAARWRPARASRAGHPARGDRRRAHWIARLASRAGRRRRIGVSDGRGAAGRRTTRGRPGGALGMVRPWRRSWRTRRARGHHVADDA